MIDSKLFGDLFRTEEVRHVFSDEMTRQLAHTHHPIMPLGFSVG